MAIKDLFKIEKKPRKGLFAMEWVVLAYMALTLLIILFAYTKVVNPEAMIWGRLRIGVMTVALWVVYRMVPCRFTRFTRVLAQMALLGWWYPDTYEINRMFPNLDHVFAGMEQQLFGMQPSLEFSMMYPQPWISEVLDMAYASYYPIIVLVVLYYFFRRYEDFERCVFIVMGSFMMYYVIFDLLPVAGPTYYFAAIGLEQAHAGVFPDMGNYFHELRPCMASPGWKDGFFYEMVEIAKDAGERPTAAFPSSHVGISVVLSWLAVQTRQWWLSVIVIVITLLICLATVYIQAHYAVDSLAGLVTGTLFYWVLYYVSRDEH